MSATSFVSNENNLEIESVSVSFSFSRDAFTAQQLGERHRHGFIKQTEAGDAKHRSFNLIDRWRW